MKEIGRTTYAGLALVAMLAGVPSLLTSSSSSQAPTPAQWRAMGRTHAASGRLANGCKYYHYTYRVKPPSGTWWTLETFIVGPNGRRLASDVILSGSDPKSGRRRFQLCRTNTPPGRFKIRGKLTYKDYPDEYSGWIATSHFTLRRP